MSDKRKKLLFKFLAVLIAISISVPLSVVLLHVLLSTIPPVSKPDYPQVLLNLDPISYILIVLYLFGLPWLAGKIGQRMNWLARAPGGGTAIALQYVFTLYLIQKHPGILGGEMPVELFIPMILAMGMQAAVWHFLFKGHPGIGETFLLFLVAVLALTFGAAGAPLFVWIPFLLALLAVILVMALFRRFTFVPENIEKQKHTEKRKNDEITVHGAAARLEDATGERAAFNFDKPELRLEQRL